MRSLKKRRPSKIILDLDSTDDHTHGQQEFSFYHGYYRNHMLHPLLIFDAATGDLVCAVLRPGNKGCPPEKLHPTGEGARSRSHRWQI